jgi:hypothetical protein
MTLNASGNLGVGTGSNTVEALLHVQKSASGGEGGYIYVDNPASAAGVTNKAGIKFGTSSGASFSTTPTGEITNLLTNSGNGASALTFSTFDGSASGERARIDAAGNLLVGQTSTTRGTAGRGVIEVNGSSNSIIALNRGGTAGGYIFSTSGEMRVAQGENSPLTFFTNDTERARITSGGDLLVGFTSGGSASTSLVKANGYNCKPGLGNNLDANTFNIQWLGGGVAELWIDSTNVGNITLSSDYRVKKNVQTQSNNAIERILRLRPVTYELADYENLFKADGVQREGFIAHEVQEVIPSGAEGQKDEEHRIQNLRVDAILSVVVKAIQELKAEIDQLKGT